MMKTLDRPYPGARPFQQTDHSRFFGRADDAAVLAELWQVNHLTVAVGQVASGKTSLLNAGVLPLVTGKRSDVLPSGQLSYGSTFPFAALPEHNPYTLALLRSWSPGETATRMVGRTVRDFVRRRAGRHNGPILAAIDHAEELLADSGPRTAYRRSFLAELAEAVREEPRLHLLLLAREDAVGVISSVLGAGARHRVKPLTGQGAIEAVTGPVAGTPRSYEAGAAEAIVMDLQTSSIVLPGGGERYFADDYVEPALLQVVCARLWHSLPPDVDLITARDMRRYGNVDVALAAHCGRVIAAVADEHDLSAARLRSWLLGTFVTEFGTKGTAYEGTTVTAGMPNAVVRALQDRHLLVTNLRSGARWYELLSDRLIEPLRKATDQRPPPAEPAEYLRAAERALTLGELDVAERYAEETLRTSPDTDLRLHAEAYSLLGNLAHEREKPREAEDRYRVAARLFETVRDTGEVARQLAAVGQTLVAQGRFADAVSELRAAVDRMPNDLVMQTELGLALWQLGQGRAAVAVLTTVLEIDGGNPEALRARGEILADLGDARDALLDLDRVTSHDRPLTRAARGLALAELGDHAASSREIEDAVAEAPRNGVVLLFAARAMSLRGDKEEADELAKRAIDATDPALPPQHREIAHQLMANGQHSASSATGSGYRDPPESLDAFV